VKVALISAIFAVSTLSTALLTPWIATGSATLERAQCVYVGPSDGPPYVRVCPTQSPA
jgi:hypothetical protein